MNAAVSDRRPSMSTTIVGVDVQVQVDVEVKVKVIT